MPIELWRQFEGQVIEGKYYLNELLGAGSYGGVFLADHRVADRTLRQVAIKLMMPDPEHPGQQLQELIGATNLTHPNLLRCFDAGQCVLQRVEMFYLVMEVGRENLAEVLQDRRLAVAEVRDVAASVAAALAYLHEQKMVHCDVKSANVLRVDQTWKLTDFGLLRAMAAEMMTRTQTLLGSAAYTPPEAYEGIISPAWDVWSYGVMLVEALTQRRPFQGATEPELQGAVLSQEPTLPALPAPFDQIVRGCLKKDFHERWTFPQIQAALAGGTVGPEPEAVPVDATRRTRPAGVAPAPSPRPVGVSSRPPEPIGAKPSGGSRWLLLLAVILLPLALLAAYFLKPHRPTTRTTGTPVEEPATTVPSEPTTGKRSPAERVQPTQETKPAEPPVENGAADKPAENGAPAKVGETGGEHGQSATPVKEFVPPPAADTAPKPQQPQPIAPVREWTPHVGGSVPPPQAVPSPITPNLPGGSAAPIKERSTPPANGPAPQEQRKVPPANPPPPEQMSRSDPREGIDALLSRWVDSVRSRNVAAQASCYAPVVRRYFLQENVSRDTVRRNQQANFEQIGAVRHYDIRNVSIVLLQSDRAAVSFVKEWDFARANGGSAGAVREHLQLVKRDGQWLIEGQTDDQPLWERSSTSSVTTSERE